MRGLPTMLVIRLIAAPAICLFFCHIFGIDGLTDALEAVEHGTMQGTVYNDKEDQARMIALLTVALFQGSDIEGYGLEDDIYYMSQYRKVDADNVDTFLGK